MNGLPLALRALALATPATFVGASAHALSYFDSTASVKLTIGSVLSDTGADMSAYLEVFDTGSGAPSAPPDVALNTAGAATAAMSPVSSGDLFQTAYAFAYDSGGLGAATITLFYDIFLSVEVGADDTTREAAVSQSEVTLTLDTGPAFGDADATLPFALVAQTGGILSDSTSAMGSLPGIRMADGEVFFVDVYAFVFGDADSTVPPVTPPEPVPLPASGLLLLGGLAFAGLRRRG